MDAYLRSCLKKRPKKTKPSSQRLPPPPQAPPPPPPPQPPPPQPSQAPQAPPSPPHPQAPQAPPQSQAPPQAPQAPPRSPSPPPPSYEQQTSNEQFFGLQRHCRTSEAAEDTRWVAAPVKSLAEIRGNSKAVAVIRSYMERRSTAAALILVGPPGVGKTSSLEAARREFSYELLEINGSNDRTKAAVNEMGHALFSDVRKTGRNILCVCEEVDGLESGGLSALKGLINHLSELPTPRPLLVCTGNDGGDKGVRDIGAMSCVEMVRFYKPYASETTALLMDMLRARGLTPIRESAETLAALANGDLRKAVTALDMLEQTRKELKLPFITPELVRTHVSKNDESMGVFDDVKAAISSVTRRSIDNYEPSSDMMPFMVHENYTAWAPSLQAAIHAAEALSDGALGFGGDTWLETMRPLHAVWKGRPAPRNPTIKYSNVYGNMSAIARTKAAACATAQTLRCAAEDAMELASMWPPPKRKKKRQTRCETLAVLEKAFSK